jgi:hypothetical protein
VLFDVPNYDVGRIDALERKEVLVPEAGTAAPSVQ